MNLKKLIIFPVIIFLILLTAGTILVENTKYSGLTEYQIEQIKQMEYVCERDYGNSNPEAFENCKLLVEALKTGAKNNNP